MGEFNDLAHSVDDTSKHMINTLTQLFTTPSAAHGVLIFALVIALGLFLGSLRFFGIQLGVAGVLFAGLLFGHFNISVPIELIEFVREFGLILFVYTIGIQVGPAFFCFF
jgi:putative transport protein